MRKNREQEFNPEQPSLLERVRKSIGKRMQAMALAGFLSFTGASETYADQVKFTKPENAAAQFVLESATTPEQIESYKNRIKTQEPEFFDWFEKLGSSINTQIDNITEQVKNYEPNKDTPKNNQKILEKLKANKDFYKVQETLKNNLDKTLWNFVALDDSHSVRYNMRQKIQEVRINFKPQQDFEKGGSESAITRGSEINLSPKSFQDENGNIDLNRYANVLVHEIFHSLHPLDDKKITGLKQVLVEGLAQNATFNTLQLLAKENKNLKPGVGMNNYDERVVTSSIIDAIAKSSSQPDILAQWNAGMITDQEFLDNFKTLLAEIQLDPKIADELGQLNLPNTEKYPYETKALESILARLQMSGYKLSPEFIKSILTSNRNLDAGQIGEVENHLNIHSLKRNIASRIDKMDFKK